MKLRLFCFFSCLYIASASQQPPWADAHVMYDTAKQIVDNHRLDVSIAAADYFFVVHDGKRYALNPPGNIAAHIPGYLLYKALAKIPGAPKVLLDSLTSHIPSGLIMAGMCVLFFALLRREGTSERFALILTMIVGAGTICIVYARVPYSEALQTLLLLWLVERALALGDDPTAARGVWAGLCAGLLVETKVVNLFAVIVALAYVAVRQRRAGRRLVVALAAAAVPFGVLSFLLLGFNHLRTGSWFDFGYRQAAGVPVFAGDFYDAVYAFFFSTGKSMFLYSPALLLGVAGLPAYVRRDPGRAILVIGVFLSVFLPHCKFHDWHGGWSWGPRYLAPITPLVLLPAGPWLEGALARGRARVRRLAFAALAAVTFVVQLLGVVFWWGFHMRLALGAQNRAVPDLPAFFQVVFIPQYSPIVGHAWMLWHKIFGPRDTLPETPWQRLASTPADVVNWYKAANPDWWFTLWVRDPLARTWGVIILAILAAVMAWAGVGLWRRWRRRAA
jgi:hypothetical protein